MTYIKGIPHHKPFRKVSLDMDDEFRWGAHKNRTVRWVLANHPSYIEWLTKLGATAGIRFTPAVLAQFELERNKPTYNPDLKPYDVYKERWGMSFVPK